MLGEQGHHLRALLIAVALFGCGDDDGSVDAGLDAGPEDAAAEDAGFDAFDAAPMPDSGLTGSDELDFEADPPGAPR